MVGRRPLRPAIGVSPTALVPVLISGCAATSVSGEQDENEEETGSGVERLRELPAWSKLPSAHRPSLLHAHRARRTVRLRRIPSRRDLRLLRHLQLRPLHLLREVMSAADVLVLLRGAMYGHRIRPASMGGRRGLYTAGTRFVGLRPAIRP